MNATYSQAGNWTAIIGILVGILAKFGIITDADSIGTIISGIIIIVGIIRQYIAHKNLAKATVAAGIPVKGINA